MEPAPMIRFARPDIGEAEIAEVIDTLRSGWLTTGPKVERFERDFEAHIGGGAQAVAVSSATAGLHLALEAHGIGPGSEVIVPTHTFTATAEAVRCTGATPVFVDIDPHTLCIDPDAAARAITERTRAILPVHFAGFTAPIGRLMGFGLPVIEDAAHMITGGCHSAATVFSFHANKPITTGEGGMLVTRHPGVARRAQVMRLHGINTASRQGWRYEVAAPGFKYNMTDIAAALGIHQLKKVYAGTMWREAIAAAYDRAFSGLLRLPPRCPGHSWHLYVVQVPDRDRFISRLNVGYSVHYIPLHRQPYWRDRFGLTPAQFPASEHAYQHSVSLPIYAGMSDEAVETVIDAVYEAL